MIVVTSTNSMTDFIYRDFQPLWEHYQKVLGVGEYKWENRGIQCLREANKLTKYR